ncbi:hypothetical protein BKA62DRAFT_346896 [Auriculariales sp. MPI-PUGE-AT-0066]|nr:hypothetical protein BKA62DRAFT_346896 [Auriculariales sp. MPI-PUGE-AT-0066]
MSGYREAVALAAASSMLDHPSAVTDMLEYPHSQQRRIKPLPKRRRTTPDAASYPMSHPGRDGSGGAAGRALASFDNYYSHGVVLPGGIVHSGTASSGHDDDDTADGDYVDHLQQPNNTKKRKVPTAPHQAQFSGGFNDGGGGGGGGGGDGDDGGDKGDGDENDPLGGAHAMGIMRRRPKVSAVTMAGLQHKELLKRRRVQLSSVLGALTASDELALDQALGARYSNVPGMTITAGRAGEYMHTRGGNRYKRRKVLARIQPYDPAPELDMEIADFTYDCHSSSSDRMVAMRDEVQLLYSRFETELTRQAAKAAEAAKQSQLALAAAVNSDTTVTPVRRAPRSSTGGGARAPAATPQAIEPPPPAKGRQKKKKRSALANASNPHHLRNYVPSRLPHGGSQVSAQQQAVNQANSLGPFPLRFLSAEVPLKRRKKTDSASGGSLRSRSVTPPPAAVTTGTNPADEWICPFCEYNLFYGDDGAFRRAVKSRKKILQRRRRARERAAAAANGVAPTAPAPPPAQGDEATLSPMQAPVAAAGDVAVAKTLVKRDRDKGVVGSAAA